MFPCSYHVVAIDIHEEIKVVQSPREIFIWNSFSNTQIFDLYCGKINPNYFLKTKNMHFKSYPLIKKGRKF